MAMKNFQPAFFCNNAQLSIQHHLTMLDLQLRNHRQTLSIVQCSERGYLTYGVTKRCINASNTLRLLQVAQKYKRSRTVGEIVGFACGMPFHIARNISHLDQFLSVTPDHCYGLIVQIIIAEQFRYRGIGGELLDRLTQEAIRQNFEMIFCEIGASNTIGMSFMTALEFKLYDEFTCGKIFYKDLR